MKQYSWKIFFYFTISLVSLINSFWSFRGVWQALKRDIFVCMIINKIFLTKKPFFTIDFPVCEYRTFQMEEELFWHFRKFQLLKKGNF